ncbi:MAG: ABC transporter substrate-binding protein [Myxococcaceae bacterium]|nr:ABC transporter substrate-binding protein [Myxococcaceae bacterium]
MLLGSCSLTTATGFEECKVDVDCAASSACIDNYCIRLPEGCARGPGEFKQADRIAFAGVLPLTDSSGVRDESEFAGLDAFTQAIEEMNQKDGANGRRFGLYVCDTQRDGERAETQAGWLATELGIPAIITSGSQQSLDVSGATRASQTFIMSATATSPELVDQFSSNTDSLLWRTAPPDTLQGRVLANILVNDPTYAGATKIGIIYVNDAYGQGLSAELVKRLAGLRTTETAPFTSGDDMSIGMAVTGLVNQMVNATVVIGVTSDTRKILERAFLQSALRRTSGHRWAFADASKDPTILGVPNAVTELAGSLGTAPAQGAGSAYPTFRNAYRTRFGTDPSSFSFTSHSYDAMYLVGLSASYATGGGRTLNGRTMADAMGKVVSTGPAVTIEPSQFSALRNTFTAGQTVNVEGNSGKLDFIPDAGAPVSPIEQWRIEGDGGFTTVQLVDPPN